MTRTFWDGIEADVPWIPTTAQGVMGYVRPSSFAWLDKDWARFANSTKVKITPSAAVFGLGVHMLDVEPGDATPAQAPGWVVNSRRAGQDPTVYCALSEWAAVQAAMNAANVPHPNYVIAHYDGDPTTMPTLNGIVAVGKQYLSTARYDLTAVPGYWPGVDPAPTVPTEEDMPSYQTDLPAGDDLHVNSCVAGCPALYFPGGYSDALVVHQLDFFGATPTDPAPAATGVGGGHDPATGDWVIDPNRPGPVPVPPGAVMVTVRYSTTDSTWKLAAGPLPA